MIHRFFLALGNKNSWLLGPCCNGVVATSPQPNSSIPKKIVVTKVADCIWSFDKFCQNCLSFIVRVTCFSSKAIGPGYSSTSWASEWSPLRRRLWNYSLLPVTPLVWGQSIRSDFTLPWLWDRVFDESFEYSKCFEKEGFLKLSYCHAGILPVPGKSLYYLSLEATCPFGHHVSQFQIISVEVRDCSWISKVRAEKRNVELNCGRRLYFRAPFQSTSESLLPLPWKFVVE